MGRLPKPRRYVRFLEGATGDRRVIVTQPAERGRRSRPEYRGQDHPFCGLRGHRPKTVGGWDGWHKGRGSMAAALRLAVSPPSPDIGACNAKR